MHHSNDESELEMEIEHAMLRSMEEDSKDTKKRKRLPKELYVFPLLRRPFFPGMAAPIAIEPGPFYDVLKRVAKSDDKTVALLLSKKEDLDVYSADIDDLYQVGVLARILRIIPMEQGGAQVILNMEQRLVVKKTVPDDTGLKVRVSYHTDSSRLTQELKAYAISIISTIKELLKLNPLRKSTRLVKKRAGYQPLTKQY